VNLSTASALVGSIRVTSRNKSSRVLYMSGLGKLFFERLGGLWVAILI
jgi:hypothetical protein